MSYPSLHNNSFIKALLRQPTLHTPVWLMGQAGHHLPEYRQLRAKAGCYLSLLKYPDYTTEATLQPFRHLNLDAAVVTSDILTLADAMGLGLYFFNGQTPRLRHPLRDEKAIHRLRVPEPRAQEYLYQSVAQSRRALEGKVPLIGVAGSPWSLACYMVEGGPPGDFQLIRRMLYRRPELLHRLLLTTSQAVAASLNAQIESGAQVVMLLDPFAGALANGMYQRFSLFYAREVLARVHKSHHGHRVPSVLYTRGASQWLVDMTQSGVDCLGLDSSYDLGMARQLVGNTVALQGNLDPAVLLGDEACIRREVQRTLQAFGPATAGMGHVFNLGQAVLPSTPPQALAVLVDAVHAYSQVKGGVHA